MDRLLYLLSRAARLLVWLGLIMLVSAAVPSAAQLSDHPDRRRNADFILRNVHVVDTETGEVTRDRAIVIRGNIIVAILSNVLITGADNPAIQVVDGGGAYAIPALWDAHVHLFQNGADNARAQAAAMVGHGILHARDMGSSLAARAEILPLLQAPDAAAPRIVSAGPTLWTFSLPYGDAAGQLVATDDAAIAAAVGQLHAAGIDFIKVYAGFDAPRLTRLAAAAQANGLGIAGHAQSGMTLAEQVRIGMRTVEHLDFGTLAECTASPESYFDRVIAARFRNSGEAIPSIYGAFAASVDTAACRSAMRAAAAAGLVLTPTLVATYLSAEASAIDAGRLPAWAQDNCDLHRRQFAGLNAAAQNALPEAGRRMMRIIIDAGVPVLAGSDTPVSCAGAGAALVRELTMLAEAGLAPLAVLQSATLLPGRLLGGTVTPGRIRVDGPADILLLDGNPLADNSAYARSVGLYDGRRWRDAAVLARLRSGQSM